MTSDYTIVLTKLSPNVGNDECVVLCNFGGYSTSGFEVIEVDPLEHPPPPPILRVAGSEKKHGLNRVKCK